jgi:hypothetical protein
MKIPKIILILVIIAILFVSCDDSMLTPEDAEFIAGAGFMSTFFPIIIITEEMEEANRYNFDSFAGIDFNEAEFTVTWNDFDIFDVTTILSEFPDPANDLLNELLSFANNIGNFDTEQLVITSGNAIVTNVAGDIVVNANFSLKIDVDVPDAPKGTFNVRYKLTIVNDDPESIEIFVNNQKVDFDFD